jgi:hypothetical protein
MRRFSSAELFAVLVSLASVAIAVLGNRTQERLLAASVWPYLSFTSGNTSDDGVTQVIALAVENSGNGPARIRQFTLEYDHQTIASGGALLERCCNFKPAMVLTSPVVGKVLRPGERVTLLQVPLTPEIAEGWRKLDHARFGFVYSACYCSTLDECFNIRSDGSDPTPVLACGNMPRDEQWHG